MPRPPAHIEVRPAWLARTSETALEPDLQIVDAHHHLWDRPHGQRYLFDDLLADVRTGHDVRATVFVQSRSMYRPTLPEQLQPVGEVEFVNGVAAQAASGLYGSTQACAAIVGFADLTLGERIQGVLDALVRAGGDRLRGVRNQTAWHADPEITSNPVLSKAGLLTDPDFVAGAKILAVRGLTLDVWAYHTQLDDVAAQAKQCPGTTIILDHCGGPLGIGAYRRRRDAVFDEWSRLLERIAVLPNVRLKLGGLAMQVSGFDFHACESPPDSETLSRCWRPYLLRCIDLFGQERCMFESNFPVDKGMVGYTVLWNAFKRATADYSVSERAALFRNTARETYRLG